jgi:hypothetical protein
MKRRLCLIAVAAVFVGAVIAPAQSLASEQLRYYGGDVMTKPRVYLTFWGSKWNEYSSARSEVEEMFKHLSGSGWQGILTQYFGHEGFISKEVGFTSWTDENVSVPTNVTEPGMESEILRAESVRSWPAGGLNNFYLVLPAPGSTYVNPICGAHRYSGTLNAPWGYVTSAKNASFNCLKIDPTGQERLGPVLSTGASHEYAEAVTDPVTNSFAGHWTGWMTPSEGPAGEIADECGGWVTLPNGSYVEALRDNYQHACSASDSNPLGATQTEVETVALNGNPGWVTVKGHVLSGVQINGAHLNVVLSKWNTSTSKWDPKATLETTVNNNSYEISNWNGVGAGEWRAQAEFPAQGGLASSSSLEAEGHFEIMDGYHLVARHDGKCLEVGGGNTANGATLNQWDCLNGAAYPHQVFTVRPAGGGYYELIARHSGRCVDVTNDGRGDGVRLQQWQCNGAGQQKWKINAAETFNGEIYGQYIGMNSGKCMEVMGGLSENGTPVQQWGCGGGLHQRWTLRPVNSGPVPTYSTINLGEVLNGEMGFADLSGHVDTGAYVGAVRYVNVNFQKLIGGSWSTQNTWHVTLDANGNWSVNNGEFGHAGTWRVRAVYMGEPAESGMPALTESQSPYTQEFTTKRGYRLYNRYSGKCLSASNAEIGKNATAIILWSCAPSATPGDGQMVTLVPQADGSVQIRFNNGSGSNTGRCVDVAGGSQEPRMWTHTWDCGEGANQKWRVLDRGSPWVAFQVEHSGQCLDNRGPSSNNGAVVQQYYCDAGQFGQHWKIESVE